MENLKTIKSCFLFKDLSDSDCRLALKRFSASSAFYKKGEIIKAAGNPLPSFGLVLSGTVQVFIDDINGDRIIMATVEEGVTFGESLSFLKVEEIPVSIFAAEDSSVLWLSAAALSNISCEDKLGSLLFSRFVSTLAHRTLDMNDRIQVLSKLSLRDKLLTLFSQYANKSNARTFSLPLNREQLAAYLGVNRSALSRELCKMRDEKIIEFYKNTFKIL